MPFYNIARGEENTLIRDQSIRSQSDSLIMALYYDLNDLRKRQCFEVPAAKGHISDKDGDAAAIAEFHDRMLPEAEETISAYQEKLKALEFQDGEALHIIIRCSLRKTLKIADIERLFTEITAEHEFELKIN